MMAKMKGITVCADCVYYSLKKHRCTRGCTDEGDAKDPFYKDCPLPDVRPVVRGKWIKRMEINVQPVYTAYTPRWNCSCCGAEYDPGFCNTINFCPNCGADMRGDDNG